MWFSKHHPIHFFFLGEYLMFHYLCTAVAHEANTVWYYKQHTMIILSFQRTVLFKIWCESGCPSMSLPGVIKLETQEW